MTRMSSTVPSWSTARHRYCRTPLTLMTLLCLSRVDLGCRAGCRARLGRVSARAREVTCPKSWLYGVRSQPRWTQRRPRMSSRARLSRRSVLCSGGVESAIELARDVALEHTADVTVGATFGTAAGDVGAGARAAAPASEHDAVQSAVEGTVAATVEPVANGATAACR